MGQPFKQVPWARVFVEGAVIVASILFAFGIEAWWAGKQAKSEQLELLQALEAEFEAAGEELGRAGTVHVNRQRAADQLIQIMEEGPPFPEPDSVWVLVEAAHRRTTTDPPGGVLASALGSGRLADVGQVKLRSALAAWPRSLLDHNNTEDNTRGYINNVLLPWFAENAEYPRADGAIESWSSVADFLMRSRTYRGHIWNIRLNTGAAVSENAALVAEAMGIRELLAASIR
ncbi:MAG: hypothetical protein ACKVG4_15295 [Longimicrobiales bacterium]